jgi:hypothetical protein
MIHQVTEKRESYTVDEGTMGFHDYITKYRMSFEEFVNSITQKYNLLDIEIISISYPDESKAVVVYKNK